MIQPNELRIGNYYKDIDGNISEMSAYELHQLTLKENNNNLRAAEYQPITITEEWLIDLGFQDNSLDGFYIKNNNVFIDFGQGQMLSGIAIDDVNYIHKLQNIYFVLTGKELLKQNTD